MAHFLHAKMREGYAAEQMDPEKAKKSGGSLSSMMASMGWGIG